MTSSRSACVLWAFAGAVFGCRAPNPPDFGGAPLWAPIQLSDAPDLGHTPSLTPVSPDGQLRFDDVTESAGLTAVPGGGNTHGVGIAFVDLDGDDWADIFVANGTSNRTGDHFPSRLFINNQDGTFTERPEIATMLAGADIYSVAAADIDNDGDIDLYLGVQPQDRLLINVGGGRFEDRTAASGAGGPASDPSQVRDGRSKVVAIADYDLDGDLDIVSASSTLPEPYAYLLENRGDGTFADATAKSGVLASPHGNPCAVLFSDYDNNRTPDLHIWNDRGDHVLLRNTDARFEDVTESSRLDEVGITHPMGIDAADIDHDGDLDYYVSNIGNNPLLRNNGDGTFTDITDDANTEGDYGWGLAFEDFDHDTWADLFVTQEDDRPRIAFRNLALHPPRFERFDIEHPGVLSRSGAHNVAAGFADFDHDGRVDVVAATTDGSRISLHRNVTNTGGQHWLHVRIRGAGEVDEGAVGYRVAIRTADGVQFRDVTSGSSRASQNELTVRFGLGAYDGAEWVAVLSPVDAERQTVVRNVAGDQRLVLDAPH